VIRNPRAEKEMAILKELIWQYVILHPRLASQQIGKRRIIEHLYEIYREAAEEDSALLPGGIREQLHGELPMVEPEQRPRLFARTATDIICSMTEQEAIAMY